MALVPSRETKCITKNTKRRKNKNNVLFEACNDFKIMQNLNYIYDYDDTDDENTINVGQIIPRNENQELYLKYLNDRSVDIVLAIGGAGCGKTWCCLVNALKEVFEYKNYDKILITRPIVTVAGESLGYLKGSMNDKMDPYMQPLYDIFDKYIKKEDLKYYIDEKIIEICPIGFIRGRSFSKTLLICDEMQNSTVEQMKAILTRIEPDSKLILTGDIKQSDYNKYSNGLTDFIKRYKEYDINKKNFIKLVEFKNEDIVRNPIIKTILNMYGDNE
jgi:phosphate starvation-inducible PhoH-like protein